MEERLLKLTNTVYKVLEFFPEAEPLKNKVKEKALEILESCRAEDIDLLLEYLAIAKSQGWISAINWMIISGEYEKLKLTPKLQKHVIGEKEPVSNLSNRQKAILDFLSKNEKAQVMDLQTALGSVTKRTIRRDLDELLLKGKITRMGEFNSVFYKLS